jgi:hypothetical protein
MQLVLTAILLGAVVVIIASRCDAAAASASSSRMVRQCRSKDEIESVLVAQYGPPVLALPKPATSAWKSPTSCLPPPAAAAAAGLALAAAPWRGHWRVGPREMIPDRPPRDPLQAARIDERLERFKQ